MTDFLRPLAIERSEERYRALASAAAQLVWLTNASGEVTEPMPTWQRFTGQSDGEVFGWGWVKALHPEDAPTVVARWTEALKHRSPYRVNYRLRRHDGVYRSFESFGVPVLGLEGEVREWVGACIDITERERAEEANRRLNAELERRVQERTAQLEEANRELEAFSYSVSHDLRAPLRHLMGYSQMLANSLGGQLSDTSRHYLDTIRSSATRMGALIDNLLSFSRMGRADLATERVDMGEVLRAALDDLGEERRGREVAWRVGQLPAVRGDRVLLRQVWVNLVANALKFTRTRAVAEIGIEADASGGGMVRFTIRDNGVGFDMRYVEKLFGVFQRLHHHDEFEGTGIGLASVRRIVHRHGGRVWAEGAVDAGAAFHFEIPCPESQTGENHATP
jgi:PAS domain S-box-containing protein